MVGVGVDAGEIAAAQEGQGPHGRRNFDDFNVVAAPLAECDSLVVRAAQAENLRGLYLLPARSQRNHHALTLLGRTQRTFAVSRPKSPSRPSGTHTAFQGVTPLKVGTLGTLPNYRWP